MNESLSYLSEHLEPVALELAREAAQLKPATPQAEYLVGVAIRIVEAGWYRSAPPSAAPNAIEATLAWFRLVQRHLRRFVAGELAAEDIIREGGGRLWAAFQSGEPFCAAFAAGVTRALHERLAGKCVLELGAGTGGTTRRLAPYLAQCQRFVLSDVSSKLLERTAAELRDVPLETALIDIDQIGDNVTGRFDVILATNCLHVAKDVCRTMTALRELLAPGGVLVLGEGSHYSERVPSPLCLVLALFDGWWNAPRSNWRPDPGFLSAAQWLEAYAAAGFAHASAELWHDQRRSFGGVYWGFAGSPRH